MRSLAVISVAVSTLFAAAAPALAAPGEAEVHFAHAVPGVGNAELEVNGKAIGKAGFGEASDSVSVPAGRAKLVLSAPGGITVKGAEDLAAGESYTLVAMAEGDGAVLRSFRDGPAKPGVARVRMIHSAPELGEPNLVLNGKTLVRRMGYAEATSYWTLKPGDYELVVQTPETGDEVLAEEVSLPAGSSQTALVVGSAGEESDIVLAQDDVAAPRGAPAAGFGGLAGGAGPDWLAALVAALAAGALGLAAYARFGGRHGASR